MKVKTLVMSNFMIFESAEIKLVKKYQCYLRGKQYRQNNSVEGYVFSTETARERLLGNRCKRGRREAVC